MQVFPNPATNYLYLQIPSGTFKKIIIQIKDVSGRLVKEQTEIATGNTIYLSVNLAHLKNRIYFLQVIKHSDTKVVKFEKR